MVYAVYKRNATKRGLPFELDVDKFRQLTSSDCHYCGAGPANVAQLLHAGDGAREHSTYIYNGLDRLDNVKGYVVSNVVTCCEDCNRAKLNRDVEEFKEWVKRAYGHLYGA